MKLTRRRWVAVGCLTIIMVLFASGCIEADYIVVEPLRVVNWSPANGAVCVDADSEIFVTFSDRLIVDTLIEENFHLLDASGRVPALIDYDATTFTATLTPSVDLEFDSTYTVKATAGLESEEQLPPPVDLTSSFETIGRFGCTNGVECRVASDCQGGQFCSSGGVCIDECVTNRDCPGGQSCTSGVCS